MLYTFPNIRKDLQKNIHKDLQKNIFNQQEYTDQAKTGGPTNKTGHIFRWTFKIIVIILIIIIIMITITIIKLFSGEEESV